MSSGLLGRGRDAMSASIGRHPLSAHFLHPNTLQFWARVEALPLLGRCGKKVFGTGGSVFDGGGTRFVYDFSCARR